MTFRHVSTSLLCVAALVACSACQHISVYRVPKGSDPLAVNERPLGILGYDEIHDDLEPGYHMRLYKIHKGYALKARVDRTERSSFDFVMSKDKEKKWFTGFQWKWVF